MTESHDTRGYNFHELHPVLLVSDVAASVHYFCEVLGFTARGVTHGDDGAAYYAMVCQDKVTFCLLRRERDAAAPAGTFYIHLGHADGSEDMDGLYARYLGRGVKITMPPTVQPWGLREFEIEGPDGYRFIFAVDGRPYVLRSA